MCAVHAWVSAFISLSLYQLTGRGAGSGAKGGASLDWLVELEREEDWAREDKYDAAAFGVFMGSTGFSRFQGGLGEWGEWDEMYPQLGMDFDDDD